MLKGQSQTCEQRTIILEVNMHSFFKITIKNIYVMKVKEIIFYRFVIILTLGLGMWFFNAIFKNVSFMSWQSVLLVEETRVIEEDNPDLPQVTDKLNHIMLYRVHPT